MIGKDFEFCSKQQNKSGRFLEACLLVLLDEKDSHGYSLLDRLKEFNFEPDGVNISIIYRNLKSMEDRGFVESEWVEGDQGPNKKIYKLTEEGRTAASKWIELLKFRKAQLQLIIDKYEKNSREAN